MQPEYPDYLAELIVAGMLSDAGWNVYFPHRDKGVDFIIAKEVEGSLLLRPVQVKGKYPTADKNPKVAFGYIGNLKTLHPHMVLAIPFFSSSRRDYPICVAFMPSSLIRPHSRGYKCQPAKFASGIPAPREAYRCFFDAQGIAALENVGWSNSEIALSAAVDGLREE
jgi:hypothetical protein